MFDQRQRTTGGVSCNQTAGRTTKMNWLYELISENKKTSRTSLSQWGITKTTFDDWSSRDADWIPQSATLQRVIRSKGFHSLKSDAKNKICNMYAIRSLNSIAAGSAASDEFIDAIKYLVNNTPPFLYEEFATIIRA